MLSISTGTVLRRDLAALWLESGPETPYGHVTLPMEGSQVQRSNARAPFLFIIASLLVQAAPCAIASQSLQGDVQESRYTSPSGHIQCDISKYDTSPGFFIDEAFDPGESETLSFGMDAGTHFEIWTIRRQREGRVEYTPMSKDGFPVTGETFIPYFYSELPYEIGSVEQFVMHQGHGEVLRVQMDEQTQLHAYWLDQGQGWLNSIQFVPTLADSQEDALELEAVKSALGNVLEHCTFK